MRTYDVAVIGLGAMGSATLFHLSRNASRVIGLDRYAPPHALGSTHGHSRIIREAYFEHPSYVPLVRRAYDNWAELERLSRRRLFQRTGGLMMGAPDAGLVTGTLQSARDHDIDVATLDAREIARRFPVIRPQPHMIGVLEHRAGILDPEACIKAHLELARENGAEVWTNSPVERIARTGGAFTLTTGEEEVRANNVVISAGAWTRSLLEQTGVDVPLTVERQTMHWFDVGEEFSAHRLPVTLIEYATDRYFYFIPDQGQGLKAAIHYEGAFVDADAVDRTIAPSDVDPLRTLLEEYIPALSHPPRESAVCLYTNTPDKHFLVDAVTAQADVHVISACSGHGFKFASSIGEIMAARALGNTPPLDLSHFGRSRLSAS